MCDLRSWFKQQNFGWWLNWLKQNSPQYLTSILFFFHPSKWCSIEMLFLPFLLIIVCFRAETVAAVQLPSYVIRRAGKQAESRIQDSAPSVLAWIPIASCLVLHRCRRDFATAQKKIPETQRTKMRESTQAHRGSSSSSNSLTLWCPCTLSVSLCIFILFCLLRTKFYLPNSLQ